MSVNDSLYRSYERHPTKAAQRAAWHRHQAAAARLAGDLDTAVSHYDRADALEAVLDRLERCRKCGRELEDPDSVALKIGPTCRKKIL